MLLLLLSDSGLLLVFLRVFSFKSCLTSWRRLASKFSSIELLYWSDESPEASSSSVEDLLEESSDDDDDDDEEEEEEEEEEPLEDGSGDPSSAEFNFDEPADS